MLKKGLRLRTKEEFARVFRQGSPLFFGAVGCKIAQNSQKHLRLGFSLSKKHLDTAVSRNRLRRAIVGSLLPLLSQDILILPVDIVFFTVRKMAKKEMTSFASQAQSIVEYLRSK